MKKTKLFKTFVLLILSVTLLGGMLPSRTHAASTVSGKFEDYKDGTNATPNGHLCSYVSINNHYFDSRYCTHETKNMGGGAKDGIYESLVLYAIKVNGEKHPAYCIEPGAPVDGAWAYNGATGAVSTDPYWEYLKDNYPKLIEAIGLTIGYTAQYKNNSDYNAARTACQIILWEFMANFRDRTTRKVTDPTLRNAMAGSNFVKYYDLISNQLIKHYDVPSFVETTIGTAPLITLNFDTAKQTWSKTVTSTTGAANLLDYSSLSALGVNTSTSGQKLTLTTSKQFSTTQTKSVSKILPDSLFNEDLYVWTAYDENGDRGQCIVTGAGADPVSAYIKVATEAVGELKITKTSEDGIISGVSFSVSDGKNSYTVKTDSSGIAKIKLLPGTYTVTELNTPNRYETPKSATVTVKANTTVTVDVNNVLRKGTLKIVKFATDNNVENVKFTVTNSSSYSKVVYTDKNGVATISGLLPGNYSISETADNNIYYIPENQTVTVTADKTATVNFSNINKRKLTVRYFDKYTLDVIHEEYTYTDKHNAPYDVTEQTAVMIDGYEFIDRIEGDAITGTLDTDKVIDVYYGYSHKITVNYFDKYTDEVINSQYISEPAEHLSEYDVVEQVLEKIEYTVEPNDNEVLEEEQIAEIIKYYLFPELNSGDTISGVLDCDKVINLYYGYDHNVTVNYFDKYTNEVIYTQHVSEPAEHLTEYDVTDHKLEEIEFSNIKYKLYDSLTTGDTFSGTLDSDKVINLYYGYDHNVTVNYFDKYTNEVIYTQHVSEPAEHLSKYDVTVHKLEEIQFSNIQYKLYDSLTTGDTFSGTLDSDKVINLYYGYDHNVTIEYRDEDTGEIISETVEYIPEGEHNADYDKTDVTGLEIEGYTKTKVTGDSEKGTLDTDKVIIVWYKKNPEPLPETDDKLTTFTLLGLLVSAACGATLLKKKKEE